MQYVQIEILLTPAQKAFITKVKRQASSKVREAIYKVYKVK